MNTLAVGANVKIMLPPDSPFLQTKWWPKAGEVTGTVQKVFKNGRVAVAVHQIANSSGDGCYTAHIEAGFLIPLHSPTQLTADDLSPRQRSPRHRGLLAWRSTAPTPPHSAADGRYTSVPHAAGT
jgi:hypothetical protein